MNGLSQAIKEFNECNHEFEKLREQNRRCSKNAGTFSERKEKLAAQVQSMELERKGLVDKVAYGNAESAELDNINKSLNQAKSELAEAEELYAAALSGQQASSEQMHAFKGGGLKRRREIVWKRVADMEIEEAKKAAIPLLRRAFIAQRRSGIDADFFSFLKNEFRAVYFEERHSGEESAEMERSLVQQYNLPFSR